MKTLAFILFISIPAYSASAGNLKNVTGIHPNCGPGSSSNNSSGFKYSRGKDTCGGNATTLLVMEASCNNKRYPHLAVDFIGNRDRCLKKPPKKVRSRNKYKLPGNRIKR